MILLVNLGSTLVYLFILLNLYLLYLLLFLLASFMPKLEKCMTFLRSKLFWSWPLTFLLQQFQPLVMLSIINLYEMRTVTVLHTTSAILSITLLGVTQLSTLLIWSSIYSARTGGKIDSEKFQQKMGVAVRELHYRRGAYWNVHQMIRWTLVSVILVCLRDKYSL